MIRLILNNNKIFTTDIEKITRTSNLIKNIVIQDGELIYEDIPLDDVDEKVFELILYINDIYKINDYNVFNLLRDNNYLNFINSLNNETFFKLLSVIHYLDIEYLEDLLCNKFINLVFDKGKGELENIFNLKLNI